MKRRENEVQTRIWFKKETYEELKKRQEEGGFGSRAAVIESLLYRRDSNENKIVDYVDIQQVRDFLETVKRGKFCQTSGLSTQTINNILRGATRMKKATWEKHVKQYELFLEFEKQQLNK